MILEQQFKDFGILEFGEKGYEQMILFRSVLFCWRTLKFASAAAQILMAVLLEMVLGSLRWLMSQVWLESFVAPCDTLLLFG